MKYVLIILTLSLTSCTVYRQKFDCPPDPGVPCTSVTDLEQMVVETERGPDLFILSESTRECKRVWIPGYRNCEGCWIPGHYLEIN